MSNDCFSELLQELETNKDEILTASCSEGRLVSCFQTLFSTPTPFGKNTLCPLNIVLIIKRRQAGRLVGFYQISTTKKNNKISTKLFEISTTQHYIDQISTTKVPYKARIYTFYFQVFRETYFEKMRSFVKYEGF